MRASTAFLKCYFFCLLVLRASLALANTESVHSAKFQSALELEAPAVPAFKMPKGSSLSWESPVFPERKRWSRYMFKVINQHLDQLELAEDAQGFCSKYKILNRTQKILVWGQLFVGISQYESGWDPADQTIEPEQGNDPYTGQPVCSEGLLQLSYQDQETSPYCDFNWDQDKLLPKDSLHRTTLNPYRNLYCGIGTMADLVVLNKRIIVSSGGYWSTLQDGSPHQQINRIKRSTQRLPFCQ